MRNFMGRGAACAMLVAILSMPLAAHGGVLVIDTFEEVTATWPQSDTTIGSGITENVTSVLGDFRYTQITQAVLDESFDSVQVGVFPVPGVFDYASSIGADGRALLGYDGDGTLSADLFNTPVIAVEIGSFDYANALPLDVNVTLRSNDDVQTISQSVNAPVGGPSAVLSFDFLPFSGSLNLTEINEITVEFDPGLAGDFRVQEIRAIPEPASLMLLLVGGGFVIRRRMD